MSFDGPGLKHVFYGREGAVAKGPSHAPKVSLPVIRISPQFRRKNAAIGRMFGGLTVRDTIL